MALQTIVLNDCSRATTLIFCTWYSDFLYLLRFNHRVLTVSVDEERDNFTRDSTQLMGYCSNSFIEICKHDVNHSLGHFGQERNDYKGSQSIVNSIYTYARFHNNTTSLFCIKSTTDCPPMSCQRFPFYLICLKMSIMLYHLAITTERKYGAFSTRSIRHMSNILYLAK